MRTAAADIAAAAARATMGTLATSEAEPPVDDPTPSDDGATAGAKPARRASKSRSERAGVAFPVARFEAYLRERVGKRRCGGAAAAVALAAVAEHVGRELLVAAKRRPASDGRKRIAADDVTRAASADAELARLFASAPLYMADCVPRVSREIAQATQRPQPA